MPHPSHQHHAAPIRVLGALLAVLVGLVAGLLVMPGAEAAMPAEVYSAAPASTGTMTVFCAGFAACNTAGLSNNGYKNHFNTMFWRMYSGSNCVNYVAYRMIQAGLPNTRPWSGTGNATNWGVAMSSITNRRPLVGSVAWWRSNAPGASADGHVAYVEAVISPTDIIVSESNWDGAFDWREVTTGKDWPSGFIHFKDVALTASTAPAITGTAQVLAPLTVSTGKWTPATPSSYSYQWLADGAPIPGATAPTFTPGVAQYGQTISVQVKAASAAYVGSTVVTAATAATAPGVLSSNGTPTIAPTKPTDKVQVDHQLTATQPTFLAADGSTPAGLSLAVQWYANGQPIAGATSWTFTPGQPQIGKKLTVGVTASAPAFTDLTVTSAATTPVLGPPITVLQPGSISGTPTRGSSLTAELPVVDAPDMTATFQWLRDGTAIPGATAETYRLTTADVGHHISVELLMKADGYADTTYGLTSDAAGAIAPTTIVTTTPKIGISTSVTGSRPTVTVTVTAPGVATAKGRLTVTIGPWTYTNPLRNGARSVLFPELKNGKRIIKVSYAGTTVIVPATATGSVRIGPVAKAKHKTRKR